MVMIVSWREEAIYNNITRNFHDNGKARVVKLITTEGKDSEPSPFDISFCEKTQ